MYHVKRFYSILECVEYANKNGYQIISIIPRRLKQSKYYLDVDEFEMVYK